MTNYERLQGDYRQATREAQDLLNRLTQTANSEGRVLGPVERGSVEEAMRVAKGLKARLERAQADASMGAEIDRLTGHMTGDGSLATTATTARGGMSVGAQIIASDTYRWLRDTKNSRAGAWSSPASELMASTLTENVASGGSLIIPDYQPGILPLPTRPLVLADLIAPGTTESNTVGYMRELTWTNAADTVVEAGTKPESTLTFEAVTDPVRKIASWTPVTDEMLEDVPALRSYLDTRLRLGVQLAEDDQLLNGSVIAPDIIGFLARTGLATSIARVSEVNADTVLSQMMAIWIATGLQPDGIVMNPGNWKTILLTKDTTGQYYGGGPFASPHAPTLWGLPVALTSAMVANTALVGCFRTASQIFRKGGLRVEASNSHANFFIENKIAIRAEERLALCVYRPSAFGTVTNLT